MIKNREFARTGARLRGWLAAALPAGLFRAGLPPRRARIVTLNALPPDIEATALLAKAGQGGAPVDIALSPSLFLRKSVAVPAAARRDAERTIALQMRQNLPSGAGGLLWRARPVRAGAGKLDYEVLVLKQDSLAAVLRAFGAEPRRVVIADGVGFAPLIDSRRRGDRPQWFWNRAAPALAGLALIVVLVGQAWRLIELAAVERALQAEVSALVDQAAAARAAAEARDSATAVRGRDEARLASERDRLAELADLTKALDDEVWLSSLAIDGGTWQLVGFARSDVSEIIAAIQRLHWVAAVAPEGSIVIDPATGEGRFQLVVQAVTPRGLE